MLSWEFFFKSLYIIFITNSVLSLLIYFIYIYLKFTIYKLSKNNYSIIEKFTIEMQIKKKKIVQINNINTCFLEFLRFVWNQGYTKASFSQ